MRQHLQSIHRQTGVMPQELADAPKLPVGLDSLWHDFMALHHTRTWGMSAPQRIAFGEIEAMQRVQRVALKPWEIDAIRAADAAFLNHWAETKRGN